MSASTDPTTRENIENLSAACVDAVPEHYDWSEGHGESWESWEAVECHECGAVIVIPEDHEEVGDYDCPIHGMDAMGLGAEGPMMNYRYPLPDGLMGLGTVEATRAIADLPLCLVTTQEGGEYGEGGYYLALTGGGMDLTWEICRGYIALGLLPPLHFTDLPKMAGPQGEDALGVVLACLRTVEVCSGRLERARERLADVQEWVWKEEASQ